MTIQEIIGEVACATGVPAPAITGTCKTKPVAHARLLAYAAVRVAYPWYRLDDIAYAFERKCHGTLSKAFKRYADLYKSNQEFCTIARELGLPPFLA